MTPTKRTPAKVRKPRKTVARTKKSSEVSVKTSPTVSRNVSAFFAAVGRRKTAVARVRLSKGTGQVSVNGKTLKVFFPDEIWQQIVLQPLEMTGTLKQFNVSVLTAGGGVNAQATAVRLGIARALELHDAALRGTLKKAGLLTRDPREKERKKYGLKRARRAPQFSKR
jgi:small subunit ribosomal protein S9